ncbi:Flagellar type III secretion system protein FlhA [Planctomycetales bacterium 10988]|nr:Flagellar type III secretion system protein FlhA [Planctomycetales bacterium 10988]
MTSGDQHGPMNPRAQSAWSQWLLPLGVVGCVLVLLVPLPAGMVDLFLAANIAFAILLLLTTLSVKTPLELSMFPSLLLATTLARLVLNVATTRLILTEADSVGIQAAGEVIPAFSSFVVGNEGRLVVGFVIFAIILLIQFLVITKGATRIGEVSARFTLDGLPGRQMAIDADLAAGVIDEQQARIRREDLTRQADFFGAMDGASKFVRGDAIAGLAITTINLLGGLYVGLFEAGMTISEAADIFTRLTIGDGLVSQVPALLISLAAGMLVTRSSVQSDLGGEIQKQLFTSPRTLALTAGFLLMLSFTGLPKLPLIALAVGCGLLSWMEKRRLDRENQEALDVEEEAETTPGGTTEQSLEQFLHVDPMELEIGFGLIRLADPQRGNLLERLQMVRQNVAGELGIIVPKVRIADNMRLQRNQYRIKIAGTVVASGEVKQSSLLAIDWGTAQGNLAGDPVQEPAFGLPAVWIDPRDREEAEQRGYSVVDATSVLATHLTEVIRNHAEELLTRDATRQLLDHLRQTSPAAVEEVLPEILTLGQVQRVLQFLLQEAVPIRNLAAILEALGDAASGFDGVKDTAYLEDLAETARQRLARTLCDRYRDPQGTLHVMAWEPEEEDQLGTWVERSAQGTHWLLSPAVRHHVRQSIEQGAEALSALGHPTVLLTTPQLRRAFKQLMQPTMPRLTVLSSAEITRDTQIHAAKTLIAPVELEAAPRSTVSANQESSHAWDARSPLRSSA